VSLDLVDLKRLKITPRTRAWLQSEAIRSGKSQQDVARDFLDSVAADHIHAATVLMALAPSEGHSGATQGHAGYKRGRR
jgi:hypothetical protein